MGNSNEQWGELDQEQQARWDKWDSLDALPAPGENAAFDRFLERKALSREDLTRIGTRWLNGQLVTFFPDGLKYRSVVTDKRHNEEGVEFKRFKIVSAIQRPAQGCIVAEGETDGATLSRIAPTFDVAILPAGAKFLGPVMVEQLRKYNTVLAAHDNDEAGRDGARLLSDALPGVRRLVAPENDDHDWCGAARAGLIPEGWDPLTVAQEPERPPIYTLRDVMLADLGDYESNNYFEHGILPTAGLLAIHAKKKSLKSFVMLDMLRALASGTPFAGGGYDFIHPDGPARVLLFQFEIAPYFFQQRMGAWLRGMSDDERELVLDNFGTYHIADGSRPRLRVAEGFLDQCRRYADAHRATVLAFDPIQRMTGAASTDKANEMDPLLDAFAQLQQDGFTVLFCHHNNKAQGKASRDPDGMSGTQRFSGVPDSLCSLWWDKKCGMVEDDNEYQIKQRNFSFELRNGAAPSRSIQVEPDPDNPTLPMVKFSVPFVDSGEDGQDKPAPPTKHAIRRIT